MGLNGFGRISQLRQRKSKRGKWSMKTILVTGGTDGIGRGVAMHFLQKGDRVIVVGSSSAKGELFSHDAKLLQAEDRALFLQADLSLVRENVRIIEEIKSQFHSLDRVAFCAANQKHRKTSSLTKEGFEVTFSLYYLSRYLLSYGLKECLERAEKPVIVNICAPGMKGTVNWGDIQYKEHFNSIKAMFNGSRLNDLLGVAFAQNEINGKIKYILFNPWAVQTPGALEAYQQPVVKNIIKILYAITGKSIEEAIIPIIALLENPPHAALSAFKQDKEVSLTMKTFDKENAQKLSTLTDQLVRGMSV